MRSDREMLAGWIDEERQQLIEFLQGFVRAKSLNPPGDTRVVASFIRTTSSASRCPIG